MYSRMLVRNGLLFFVCIFFGCNAASASANQNPVAVPKLSINGASASRNVTVPKGVPVQVAIDFSESYDPDGWSNPLLGMFNSAYPSEGSSSGGGTGGRCIVTNFNSGYDIVSSFTNRVIHNPSSPSACNTTIGTVTFNGPVGTNSYVFANLIDIPGLRTNERASKVTVTIVNPRTSVDLRVNGSDGPLSIASGSSANLSWTSTNATSCAVASGGLVSTATSGSQSTGNIIASTTYSITCTGIGGSSSDSVTVNVSAQNRAPVAVAKLSVNRGAPSSTIRIDRSVPSTSIQGIATDSSDPDGWKTPGKGVSSGGKCEWSDRISTYNELPHFAVIRENPSSTDACNAGLGTWYWNKNVPLGTYTIDMLRITDASGAVSAVAKVTVIIEDSSVNQPSPTPCPWWNIFCSKPTPTPTPLITPTPSPATTSSAPVAIARFSINGGAPASNITVTRGVPVSVSLNAAASSDPDGWTTAGTGVSQGGKCEWNTNLDQSSPTSFKQTINNPASPAACNINLGTLTFNDAPGTYRYTLLRITDASGAKSVAGALDAKSNGFFHRIFSVIPAVHAKSIESAVSITILP